MAGLIFGVAGGIVVGVMFKDQIIWAKDKVVAAYSWARAKF